MIVVFGKYENTEESIEYDPKTKKVSSSNQRLVELYQEHESKFRGHVNGLHYVDPEDKNNHWRFLGICSMFMRHLDYADPNNELPYVTPLAEGEVE